LFSLPIYYRIIKQHSSIHTAILLLTQTAFILPCALLVDVLIRRRVTARRILFLGWVCTSGGIGLLTLLDANRAASFDVLVNLLSGIGMSIIMPALHTGAEGVAVGCRGVQSQTLLISIRYLGSALGLVAVGDIFQHVLRHNLALTKFSSMAGDMTQDSTVLVYSIHDLHDPADIEILVEATQSSLRTMWLILAITCLVMVLISLMIGMVTSKPPQRQNNVSRGIVMIITLLSIRE
jgi:ABC-type sugar transport system permease subunit